MVPVPAARPRRSRRALWIAGAVAAVGAGVYWGARHLLPSAPIRVTFRQLTDQPGPEFFPSLSPDGTFLAYAASISGNSDIYLQRVGGNKPINLTADSPADDTQPAFSPDGKLIAFCSDRQKGGGLYVMGATGESVRRITDSCYNPAWSPEGNEVVCATEGVIRPETRLVSRSELWRVNVASGRKRRIAEGDAVQPHWSPHGWRIAYWAIHNGQRDVFTMPAGGGEAVPVTSDSYVDWNPVWSPDGEYLYFSSDRGGSLNLWRIAIDERSGRLRGHPEALTTPSVASGHISLAADGRRIAYVQRAVSMNLRKAAFDPEKGLVIGSHTSVTMGSRADSLPAVSPDGQWLAFASAGKQEDIFVVRTDGTGLRQLTDDVANDRSPNWSPDGAWIGFQSNRSGAYEIWLIHPDGSALKQLTKNPGSNSPVWSSDGKRIAFSIEGKRAVIEAEGGGQPQPLPLWEKGPEFFLVTSWSPNGQKLAGDLRGPDGRSTGIAVYNSSTLRYERITDAGQSAKWLNDGRRLLFVGLRGLYLVDSQSRKTSELFSLFPHEQIRGVTIAPDNRMIYFSLSTTEADVWLLTIEAG
jgi:Tol biopolymer transport system component